MKLILSRAVQAEENVLADVRRGIWQPPKREPVEPTPDPTFHEFASEWLAAMEPGLAPGTVARYRWQLTDHLLPHLHAHRLSEITVAEVDRYREAKVREGRLSPGEINKTLTRLGQILDVAEERELIARNPMRVNPRRRKLKAPKPRAVWLTGRSRSRRCLRPGSSSTPRRDPTGGISRGGRSSSASSSPACGSKNCVRFAGGTWISRRAGSG